MQTIISPGWEISEDLSQPSGIVLLSATSKLTVLMNIVCPSGARLYIEALTARVIDAGSDLVTFYCLRNGMTIAPGYTAINGTLFDFIGPFVIQRDVGPGNITVYADNASAGAIRVTVSLQCFLLRMIQDSKNQGPHPRYAYTERY
jgi:hypothetical protein